MTKLPDLAERIFWTFVPAVTAWILTNIPFIGDLLPGDTNGDAQMLTTFLLWAVIYLMTLAARLKTKYLPDPGKGLPGLPVTA